MIKSVAIVLTRIAAIFRASYEYTFSLTDEKAIFLQHEIFVFYWWVCQIIELLLISLNHIEKKANSQDKSILLKTDLSAMT